MLVIQTLYTINSELEAYRVAEIKALKIKTFTETLFWFAGIESSDQAGIIIIKSGHEERSIKGISRPVALLVVALERAFIFSISSLCVYLREDASTIQIPCSVSYARDDLSQDASGLSGNVHVIVGQRVTTTFVNACPLRARSLVLYISPFLPK